MGLGQSGLTPTPGDHSGGLYTQDPTSGRSSSRIKQERVVGVFPLEMSCSNSSILWVKRRWGCKVKHLELKAFVCVCVCAHAFVCAGYGGVPGIT